MKALTVLSNGAATMPAAGAREKWGFPQVFVISQTAIPALLYLPGSQQFRLYIRIASFAISPPPLPSSPPPPPKSPRPHPPPPRTSATTPYPLPTSSHPFATPAHAPLAQFLLY